MATVFNNINKVAGDPQMSTSVAIEIVWDRSVSPVARVDDDDKMIQAPFYSETDDDGRWETNLVSNDSILPADSLYRVTEKASQNTPAVIYYISVPDNATPTFWAGDLIVTDVPVWV